MIEHIVEAGGKEGAELDAIAAAEEVGGCSSQILPAENFRKSPRGRLDPARSLFSKKTIRALLT